MPAGTTFTSTIDDVSYQFVTVSDVTISNSGNSVIFKDTNIYEGTFVTAYTVDSTNVDQRFLLTDPR